MESKNARLGLQLFFIYLFLYGGFVLINTFSPETMELTPIAGINLAILSGFGLIIAALMLSFIYGVMCHGEDVVIRPAEAPRQSPGDSSEASARENSL